MQESLVLNTHWTHLQYIPLMPDEQQWYEQSCFTDFNTTYFSLSQFLYLLNK